jgi:MoxR-like ATPase
MPYPRFDGKKSPFYEAEPHVAEVVNFAIALGRPILVEGEPGSGKTTLAHAIAYELELGTPRGTPIATTVKSTFQAKDLLYRFNAFKRLQDIQDPTRRQQAQFVYPYITLQPLGKAIQRGQPAVVLIDEIDKADIDFPNDLLEVLGAFGFDIDEMPAEEDELSRNAQDFGRRVESAGPSAVRPIVVITSNREKQLPEPFLRRCLYIELKFPEDPEVLTSILQKNLGKAANEISGDLLKNAIARFLQVRKQALKSGAQKPPATSELIDWVKVLHWQGSSPEALLSGEVPYWKVLFKTMQDLDAFGRHPK